MSKVVAWNPPVTWVREQIEKAGTTIGSVHFKKRGDGELRKMSYRLHVRQPSTAKAPKGIGAPISSVMVSAGEEICTICNKPKPVDMANPKSWECLQGPWKVKVPTTKPKVDKKVIDKANDLLTVLDCNKTVRDELGNIKGRGAWRSISLEGVVRIKNKGCEVIINRY